MAEPKLLFVDDEPNIRFTLSAILKKRGFEVTTAATVPEALSLIAAEKFDILISDLNIGDAGDGFTVVSAMRRTQPSAATFILTGYPAFETALEAIRQQVDDYFVKPTNVDELVEKLKTCLSEPKQKSRRIEPVRASAILDANKREIVGRWLSVAKEDGRLCSTRLSDHELADHLPAIIDELIRESEEGELSPKALKAAQLHGRTRFQQGCSTRSYSRGRHSE